MVLYRGLADDLALMDWLHEVHLPGREAKTVSPEFVRVGTRLAALEMIESGTTTFADMYYFEDDIAKATKEAGLRAVLGQSVIKFPVADAPTPEDALARADAFIAKWKDDALVTPAVAPHAPYTLEPATLQAARALANKYGVPLLIHLAETQDEIKIVARRAQETPARYPRVARRLGRPLARRARRVARDAGDIEVLAQTRRRPGAQSREQHEARERRRRRCPTGSRAALRVGLGTDGAASNNDLDMFEAMRAAAFLHKVRAATRRRCRPRQALRAGDPARRRGAGHGRHDRQSSRRASRPTSSPCAMAGARQTPMFDPISHLVYVARGDDVQTTIVAGRC